MNLRGLYHPNVLNVLTEESLKKKILIVCEMYEEDRRNSEREREGES